MKRTTIAVLGLVAGTAAGCKDMGLEGNVPLEEAQDRPPSALVAAVLAPVEAVNARLIVDGRLWIPSGQPLTLQESDVRAVGSATGQTVYARRWDESPYDALFVRAPSADAGRGAARQTPGTTATTATTGTTGTTGTPGTAAGGGEWIELQPVRGRSGPLPGQPAGTTSGQGAPAAGAQHGGH